MKPSSPFGEPQLGGREDAAVAGDHLAVARNQHRHGPAELRDARGDLRDLVGAVRLRVARIGPQPLERPGLDRLRGKAQRHRRVPVVEQKMDPVDSDRVDTRGGSAGPLDPAGSNRRRWLTVRIRAGSGAVGTGFAVRVASQKIHPDAGGVLRCAPRLCCRAPRRTRAGPPKNQAGEPAASPLAKLTEAYTRVWPAVTTKIFER